jgi:SAM-dependent methyltransferase
MLCFAVVPKASCAMVELIRDEFGFLRVDPVPSVAELAQYYQDNYFGGGKVNSYADQYSAEEIEHKSITHNEALHAWRMARPRAVAAGRLAMLDVGCGEGFAMAGFAAAGWAVTGIDLTSDGIRRFNPQIEDSVILGDLFGSAARLADGGRTFDFIMCTNVLEHVRDPSDFFAVLGRLAASGALLRIEVPNDGSWLHDEIIRENCAAPNFFVAYPDHLSYFTLKPLLRLAQSHGWKLVHALADYPIELFVLNPHSNYQRDRSRGKAAHQTRLTVENHIARMGIDRLFAFREGCAKAEIGRNIIGYFTPN